MVPSVSEPPYVSAGQLKHMEPPSSPYYTAPPGDPTPYGDELVAQLRGMAAEPGGAFAPVAFARAYLSYARDGCFADSACRRSRLNGVSKWWLECMVGSPVGEWETEWNAGRGVRLADAGVAGRAAAAREDEAALAAGRWRDCPPREERAAAKALKRHFAQRRCASSD